MKYKFHHSLTSALLFIVALAATALGCVWLGTPDSVRFNDYLDYNKMGRLPPLPRVAGETNSPREDEESAYEDSTLSEKQSRAVDGVWETAKAFEKDGKITEELNRLLEYLKQTRTARIFCLNPDDREHRRNAAIDKLDALTALNQGSPRAHVQAYLLARTLHDQKATWEEVEKALGPAASDINLKDNVAYLKAAGLYRDDNLEDASSAFAALARKYPQSEKREAALFMAALRS